jgi:hypothetical protein
VFFEVFRRAIESTNGIIEIKDASTPPLLTPVRVPIDNGILTFSDLYAIQFAAYNVIERKKPLRPQFGALTLVPPSGMFYFMLDRRKAETFFDTYFNKGESPTGFGSAAIPDIGALNVGFQVLWEDRDWRVLQSMRDRRQCVLRSHGVAAHNARAESLGLPRMSPLRPHGDGSAGALQFEPRQNRLYYISRFNLRKLAGSTERLRLRVHNTLGNDDDYVAVPNGSITDNLFGPRVTESRLRNSNSMYVYASYVRHFDKESFIEPRLTDAGKRILATTSGGVLVFTFLQARRPLPISEDELESVGRTMLTIIQNDLGTDPSTLPDLDRELLSRISIDEIKAKFLREKDAFLKRLNDDPAPAQENDFEITTFADELSLIGFVGASAKAAEVCRAAMP